MLTGPPWVSAGTEDGLLGQDGPGHGRTFVAFCFQGEGKQAHALCCDIECRKADHCERQ